MKRNLSGLIISLTLLLSLFIFAETADANFIGALQGLPAIIIENDGTVVPQTEYIKQEGSIYKLTADLQQTYVIVINCSNIVFDGQGHVINGTEPNLELHKMGAYGYYCHGIHLENVSNVAVKGLSVLGFTKSSINVDNSKRIDLLRVQADEIRLAQSTYCHVSESVSGLYLQGGVKYTTISKSNISLLVSGASENLIYENNIFASPTGYSITTGETVNSWDNGSVGNYWSDYMDRYPDALEIGDTGVADKSYLVDGDNIDHYPLMRPVSIQQNQEPSVQGTKENESFPMILMFAVVFIVAIAGAIVGLVIKKRSYRGKVDE
jgi:hypothetical protein